MPVDNSLVSNVTSACKVEKVVAETIRSVQAQSYPHREMLVAEDRDSMLARIAGK